MVSILSRREFLKLGGLALGSMALSGRVLGHSSKPNEATGLVRVGSNKGIVLYKEPSYQSDAISTRKKDQLLYVYEQFDSPEGPSFNPRWYRLDEGFAHTAYLQPVETRLNTPVSVVNPDGELFEITVPLSQSYRNTKSNGWEKLYRLYYLSVH